MIQDQIKGLKEISNDITACQLCDLHKTRTKTCPGNGIVNANADQIRSMLVGEAPGADEDSEGRVFIGRSGKLLRETLKEIKFTNIFITNTIKCRPPGNRDPNVVELDFCLDYLTRQIQVIKPEMILCIGRIAQDTVLKLSYHLAEEQLWCDYKVEFAWHPSYILRNGGMGSEKYDKWVKCLTDIKDRNLL